MRNQTYRWIDIFGLVLSGSIAIGLFTALYDRTNLITNYRETDISEMANSLLVAGLMLVLMILQAIALFFRFYQPLRSRNLKGSIVRLLLPILIVCAFLSDYNGFPGVMAPVEVRQQWALKEFRDYPSVVKAIETCPAIVDRVGQVKFVAPTRGTNYILYEPGSSGHWGELTLEVIGDKATGIANSQFHIFTAVGWVQWTQQNNTETLKCF